MSNNDRAGGRASGGPWRLANPARTELMALSMVPAGVATEALGYLPEGGPANLGQLASFLSDTLLFTGTGFDPTAPLPRAWRARPARP